MIRSAPSRSRTSRRNRPSSPSTFMMTRHLTQPWYCVRRIRPAPDSVASIPMLRAQLGVLGAVMGDEGEEPPEWEAGRLLDILTYELSHPAKVLDLIKARRGALKMPDGDDPRAVRRALGQLVAALAKERIYLADTDHLTDGQLLGFIADVVVECECRGVGDQIFVVSECAGAHGEPRVANRDRYLPRPSVWADADPDD